MIKQDITNRNTIDLEKKYGRKVRVLLRENEFDIYATVTLVKFRENLKETLEAIENILKERKEKGRGDLS